MPEVDHIYILTITVGLLIVGLIKYYFVEGKKRSLPLIKSFQVYANNYTYTCDAFATNLVCQRVKDERDNFKSGNLLIIGAGPKPVIKELIKLFDKIYLIDPNYLWHEQWKKLDWYHNSNIFKIQDTFDNIDKYLNFKNITFEWIIAAHVFYYIKQQDLDKNIKLINKYLDKANGKIIISVAKDMKCDIAKLCNYIQPQYKLSQNITNALIKNNMKYIEIPATNEGDMDAQNKYSLINIMTMHLDDYIIDNDEYENVIRMNQSVLRQKVSKWIDENMKVDPEDKSNVIYYQHTAHYVVE